MKKLVLFIIVLTFWGCDDNSTGSDDGNGIVTIEITEDSFLPGSPSVWFSPSTGEITGTGESETPPEEKYIYWIEPQDPEFATWLYGENQDTLGSKFIGTGDNFFQNTTSTSNNGFSQSIVNPESEGAAFSLNSVYFLRDYDADCLIQIIDWQQTEHYLKFKWKKL